MYRLMQPSEEAAVVALWQAERGDSAAFAKTALEPVSYTHLTLPTN